MRNKKKNNKGITCRRLNVNFGSLSVDSGISHTKLVRKPTGRHSDLRGFCDKKASCGAFSLTLKYKILNSRSKIDEKKNENRNAVDDNN
jgi:hypothetical protein